MSTPPLNAGGPQARGGVTLRREGVCGEVRADVDLVGGGLRSLSVEGVDLIETYPEGDPAPCCAGAVLFPWPNRVRDARWTQRGVHHELAVTERDLGNANHGLVLAAPFTVDSRSGSAVALSVSVTPRPGYPFRVRLRLSYRLTEQGIEVGATVTNESLGPAPVALGAHPYLRIGDWPAADLLLQVAASTCFELDGQLIPVRQMRVAGTDLDFRQPRRVAATELNTCFGDLELVDGRSSTVLSAPDGREVELWAGEGFRYVQVYTCPDYPGTEGLRRAVAVEPMTAPADALNSGLGLSWLAPEGHLELSWGICARSSNAPRQLTSRGADAVQELS